LVLGWKEFNGTPHFYSLPKRDERKNFKIPLTLTLSRGVERGLAKVKLGIGGF
jgi:hypothetical protein